LSVTVPGEAAGRGGVTTAVDGGLDELVELDVLAVLAELVLDELVLDEPTAAVPVVDCDPWPLVDVDDPLPPHAVSMLPTTSDPATISVHERTPVLLIGTPRIKTPFQLRLVRRITSRPTGARTGLLIRRELPSRTAVRGPSPLRDRYCHPSRQFLIAIPATPLS
jgi:hypothetical protein